MSSFAQLRQLSWPESWLLVQAALLLPLTALALRGFGFRRWQALLARLTPGDASRPVDRVLALAQACHTAWLVTALARRLPYQATCLHQSLTLWWLLRRQGLPGELRIGVRHAASRFEAHAWVEYQGVVLNDAEDVQQRFAPFDGAIVPIRVNSR